MRQIFTSFFLFLFFISAHGQSRYQDSLALVDLYNSTNGASWFSSTGWLTDPLDTWEGVTLTNNRVSDIMLDGKNLTGQIPASIGQLTSLQVLLLGGNNLSGVIPAEIGNLVQLMVLDLSRNSLSGAVPATLDNLIELMSLFLYDNALTDLPAFSNMMPFDLRIENNAFTFEDIVPNMNVALNSFVYAPQDSVGMREIVERAVGSSLTYSVTVGGVGNVYQWYKDGLLVSGQTNSTLDIPSVSSADYGDYRLHTSNTAAPDLILISHTMTLVEGVTTNINNSLATLEIFPNPVTNFFLIKNLKGNEGISLKDLNGRIVKEFTAEDNVANVSIDALDRGVYILEVSSGNSKKAFRIIKQ